MPMPLPQRIGRYEVLRELGRGMMGVVYQAKDPALNRNVALKTISLAFAVSESDRETFEARFLQEARAAAALSHPSIVVVYDVGVDVEAGALYMALQFLRGKTLEAILAAGDVLDRRGGPPQTGPLGRPRPPPPPQPGLPPPPPTPPNQRPPPR